MDDADIRPDDPFVARLADWCRRCADVVLDRDLVHFQPRHDTESEYAFAVDWRYCRDHLHGTADCPATEPATWIALISSTYLTESTLLCRSIANLLEGGAFAIGLDVLTRAALERNGRLRWVLDPDITQRQRAIRAGLEITVCQQHYRRSIEQIATDNSDKRAAKAEHVRLRNALAMLFGTVEMPPSDPCDNESPPSAEAADWIVDGEAYPTYANVVRWPLGKDLARKATGTYGGYAGFSHPNVQFAAEHRRYDPAGHVSYVYRRIDAEKDARLAAWTTLDSARHWVSYIGGDVATLRRRIDELDALLGSFTVDRDPDSDQR